MRQPKSKGWQAVILIIAYFVGYYLVALIDRHGHL